MKKTSGAGVTLVELMLALTISILVVSGAVRFFAGFSRRNAQQQRNAVFQQQIANAGRLIEGDIRMSGYGLPGNGIQIDETSGTIDTVHLFSNENDHTYALKKESLSGEQTIKVMDITGLAEGNWICISSGSNVTFREIELVAANGKIGFDTPLSFDCTVDTTKVFGADRISYYLETKNGSKSLIRRKNTSFHTVSSSMNHLAIEARNESDSLLTSNYQEARNLSFVVGGGSGTGGASANVRTDTVSAFIRNYL